LYLRSHYASAHENLSYGFLHGNATQPKVRGSIGADMEDRTGAIELKLFLAELKCARLVTATLSVKVLRMVAAKAWLRNSTVLAVTSL
jgi:hypothetical protein